MVKPRFVVRYVDKGEAKMTRIIIATVGVAVVAWLIYEVRKQWRLVRKRRELEDVKIEGEVLAIDEEISEERQDQEGRRAKILTSTHNQKEV